MRSGFGYFKVSLYLQCGDEEFYFVKAYDFEDAKERAFDFAETDNLSVNKLNYVQFIKPLKENN